MQRKICLALVAMLMLLPVGSALSEEGNGVVRLFYREYMGYYNFRIPSLCVAQDGSILAVAEGRMNSMDDDGDIDLVIRRSLDGGATWLDGEMIWDYGDQSVSNPTMVLDRDTGRIFLFVVLNSFVGDEGDPDFGKDDGNYYRYSDDNGVTWSDPVSVRDVVGGENWPGPGHGIQLERGEHAGRLVIPLRGGSLYSDDHGETWRLGQKNNSLGETTVVELADGTLLRNDRSSKTDGLRRFSYSPDGGETWSDYVEMAALYEPNGNGCQADHIVFTHVDAEGESHRYLIQSGPRHRTTRKNMTLMISADEGQHYEVGLAVTNDRAAYSAMAQLDNDTLLLFWEDGHAQESNASLLLRAIPIKTVLPDSMQGGQ